MAGPGPRLVNGVPVPLKAAEAAALQSEWDAAPAVMAAERQATGRNSAKQGLDSPAIKAVLLVILDEINALRTAAKLTNRTVAQMRQAIIDKIDAGSIDV